MKAASKKLSSTTSAPRLSPRKISAVRRRDFSCARRAIPAINSVKQEQERIAEAERELMRALLVDDMTRRRIRSFIGVRRHPTSVWTDCDHTWDYSKLIPYELPEWVDLSERMKMFLGYDLAMELGWCFPFTANLSPGHCEKWQLNGSDFMANIYQRLRRELGKVGLQDPPHCYVVETRTKSGRSNCKPHLHGIVICDDPVDATRFKCALERAFAVDLKRGKERRAVHLTPGYAATNMEFEDRTRWVEYITKNAHLYDQRLGRRRVYISHAFNALARKAWAIRRDEFALDESIAASTWFEIID